MAIIYKYELTLKKKMCWCNFSLKEQSHWHLPFSAELERSQLLPRRALYKIILHMIIIANL